MGAANWTCCNVENWPLAEKLLEVSADLVRTALDLERTEGTVIADSVGETPCVFLASLHRAERGIAERLMRLTNGTVPWPWIDRSASTTQRPKKAGKSISKTAMNWR